ncbi:MAG: helix-turn-helix domain-containing protein [Agathobacter sp.]
MAEDKAVLKDVAGQLRSVRTSLGITQELLAERVGTKKSNISRLESGRYNPSLEFLVKVADGLGKKVQVKIGEDDDKETWKL